MPIPTPFHERLAPLCHSYRWKDWAGRLAVCSFDHGAEPEYTAIRHAAAAIDVSPLYKYEVRGRQAAELLAQVMTRDVRKLAVGRVTYCCWCDDAGKVVDDGTVTRWGRRRFRVTAAEPSLRWFRTAAAGLEVEIDDISESVAALAVQGPRSRDLLVDCLGDGVAELRFFRAVEIESLGFPVGVTRTGYTGDLGYELWVEADRALELWDALAAHGSRHGFTPAGLDALDMSRIEAGFIMLDVDYYSAPRVVLESRKSSPWELGLGWTVDLDRDPFVGQAALAAEKERGPAWSFVGLLADYGDLERLYDRHGLPASLPAGASRDPIPVFDGNRQVGRATSHLWSPTLKQQIALASVESGSAAVGSVLGIEHTVEFERDRVRATVVETPFFDPPRKRKP